MGKHMINNRRWATILAGVSMATASQAAVVNLLGDKTSWPTTWTALTGTGLVDAKGDYASNSRLDLVGDSTDRVSYWSQDNEYAYFRFRLAVATVTTASDFDGHSYFIFIDKVGSTPESYPQFAFSWDGQQNHYLEMNTNRNTTATQWSGHRVDDFDGSPGQKGASDINGATRTPQDGFARAVDGQATTSFGTTTFFDVAVSWNYMTNQNTGLGPGQTWQVAFGSTSGANEHSGVNADMVGGGTLDFAINQGWSDAINVTAVPEIPASPWLVLGFAGLVVGGSRLRALVGSSRWFAKS